MASLPQQSSGEGCHPFALPTSYRFASLMLFRPCAGALGRPSLFRLLGAVSCATSSRSKGTPMLARRHFEAFFLCFGEDRQLFFFCPFASLHDQNYRFLFCNPVRLFRGPYQRRRRSAGRARPGTRGYRPPAGRMRRAVGYSIDQRSLTTKV